jgi:hypothetical protein
MRGRESKISKIIYKFIDSFFQNIFVNEICDIINKSKSDKTIIFLILEVI